MSTKFFNQERPEREIIRDELMDLLGTSNNPEGLDLRRTRSEQERLELVTKILQMRQAEGGESLEISKTPEMQVEIEEAIKLVRQIATDNGHTLSAPLLASKVHFFTPEAFIQRIRRRPSTGGAQFVTSCHVFLVENTPEESEYWISSGEQPDPTAIKLSRQTKIAHELMHLLGFQRFHSIKGGTDIEVRSGYRVPLFKRENGHDEDEGSAFDCLNEAVIDRLILEGMSKREGRDVSAVAGYPHDIKLLELIMAGIAKR